MAGPPSFQLAILMMSLPTTSSAVCASLVRRPAISTASSGSLVAVGVGTGVGVPNSSDEIKGVSRPGAQAKTASASSAASAAAPNVRLEDR